MNDLRSAGALEQLPVQARGWILRRRRGPAAPGKPATGRHHRAVRDRGAKVAVCDQLPRFLEVMPAALLEADLHDAVVPPGRVDHPQRRLDPVRDGLLDVHVLAGRAGIDGHRAVPVVRRRDEHGVDVLAVEDPPVVLVRLG